MKRQEVRLYKCILRPNLWWTGNEDTVKHYLIQKKDKSFRVVGIGGIKPDMKYKFTEEEIAAIKTKHPDFCMLFKLKEERVYIFGGEE